MTTAEAPAEATLTIDELARSAEVVVSTVRLYQNKGLLPPPIKRGRVGYYDAGHLARLRLIAQLQERGFSLAAIRELLDGLDRGDSLRAVLGLRDATSTWAAQAPESVPLPKLAALARGVELTPQRLERIVRLDLVHLSTEQADEAVVRNPALLRIGTALGDLGVPHDTIIDEYERLLGDAGAIAERFTAVFRTYFWEPFVSDGMPADRMVEMVDTLEQLGTLAEAVVVTTLRDALQAKAEAFIRAEADRLGLEIPRPGAPEPPP